jgi:hypothetical protein
VAEQQISQNETPTVNGRKSLFVSAFGSFWPPKTAADYQTFSFSANFYKICWDKNHPKLT